MAGSCYAGPGCPDCAGTVPHRLGGFLLRLSHGPATVPNMCSTGEIGGGARLLDVLEQAAAQLRGTTDLPLGSAVSDVQLTQAVQRLEAIGRIAAGQKLRLVAEIDRRHAYLG